MDLFQEFDRIHLIFEYINSHTIGATVPKNEKMNSFLLLCNVFLFVYWKKLKTPTRHFEINLTFPIVKIDRIILASVTKKNGWIEKK